MLLCAARGYCKLLLLLPLRILSEIQNMGSRQCYYTFLSMIESATLDFNKQTKGRPSLYCIWCPGTNLLTHTPFFSLSLVPAECFTWGVCLASPSFSVWGAVASKTSLAARFSVYTVFCFSFSQSHLQTSSADSDRLTD